MATEEATTTMATSMPVPDELTEEERLMYEAQTPAPDADPTKEPSEHFPESYEDGDPTEPEPDPAGGRDDSAEPIEDATATRGTLQESDEDRDRRAEAMYEVAPEEKLLPQPDRTSLKCLNGPTHNVRQGRKAVQLEAMQLRSHPEPDDDLESTFQREVSLPLFVRGSTPDSPCPAPMSSTIPRQGIPIMPPPSLPGQAKPPRQNKFSMGMLAKLRNTVQSQHKNKPTEMMSANRVRSRPTPDREDLLEAILHNNAPPNMGLESLGASLGNDHVNDEEEDKRAVANYKKQKQYYDTLKKQQGDLTFRQDVKWIRIQAAEEARRKKRKRDIIKEQQDRLGEQGPSLFMDDIVPDPTNSDGNFNESDGGEVLDLDLQAGPSKRPRIPLPRKEPARISMQDAEYQSMRVALEATGDAPKKKEKEQASATEASAGKRATKSKATKSRNPRSGASKVKKPSKGGRKTARQKQNDQRAVHQMSSLFTGDVFAEQAAEDAPEQPTFTSRRKADALKELIASVPLDNQKAARTEMSTLLAASKDFDGKGSVRSDGRGMWLVKGMKTSLKPYQIMGSAFMRNRENAAEEPKGGLVADQMGLGKTLMMLANIVNGKPPVGAPRKTTLLVASPSLLTQWAKEIETHTNSNITVMRYGAGTRIDSNRSYEILGQHDIVLTTYTEIMRSYPKNEPPIECQTAEQKIAWWKQVYETDRGVLHRMMFFRVVLDEAQAIKNHIGRTSIACRALMADHKWALSGTPVLNGLHELYAYFKFLNVPHTGSFKIFKHNYCGTSYPENVERLLVRLSQFMIRRTHSDVMFGAPILKLPKADQGTHWCEFNQVERNIYDIVRQRFAKRINWLTQKGELENSYSSALVMLLRLRQLTAHIIMLQSVMRDLLEREDIERIRKVADEASCDARTKEGRHIALIRAQLKTLSAEQKRKKAEEGAAQDDQDVDDFPLDEDSNPPESQDLEDEAISSNTRGLQSGKKFGKSFNFKPYLKSLTTGESWEKVKKKTECRSCYKKPRQPYITECHHIICYECYESMTLEVAEQGQEHATCKECGMIFRYAHPCDANGELDDADVGPTTRSKKKQAVRPEQEEVRDDWLSLGGGEVLPSAKTIAIKAQILNWIQEEPDVKIIVYTQFIAMIRILAQVCKEEGWGFEQYYGKMSFNARDKAIAAFADQPRVKILLASLRCGGLGLNLTMASRVIIVDPWWNSASEQQAFCRVFRIGQKETTFMTRFCVKGTVDEKLIQMQEKKKEEIDEVMEDDGSTVKKMNIKDLMHLFGDLGEDSAGRPFIIVDNPDSRGGFRPHKDDEGYADEI